MSQQKSYINTAFQQAYPIIIRSRQLDTRVRQWGESGDPLAVGTPDKAHSSQKWYYMQKLLGKMVAITALCANRDRDAGIGRKMGVRQETHSRNE